MTPSDELERLERTLHRLDRELEGVRSALANMREQEAASASSPAAAPPFVEPITTTPRPHASATRAPAADSSNVIEHIIGRYGALSLAAITIITGAGALVSWALKQGLLTPSVRVMLGSLLAAALAGAGLALRARGNRQFGNTLLALALAVVHVVAWGAGPKLELVPAWVSLTIADAASLALSILALRDENEELFAVGLAGALLAPFVQTTGAADYLVLAAYGLVVSSAALRTIAGRHWRITSAIVVLAALAYSRALVAYHGDFIWVSRALAPGFALALSLLALGLTRPPMRPWIALGFVALTVGLRGAPAPDGATPWAMAQDAPELLLLAITGAALALVAARALPRERDGWWNLGAIVLPLALLLQSVFSLLPSGTLVPGGIVHAAVAGLWVVAYALAAVSEIGERRGALLAVSGIVATAVAVLALSSWPLGIPAACAVVAIASAWVARREAQPIVLVAATVAAAAGYAVGLQQLMAVAGYGVPFTSAPSGALAACIAGLFVAAQFVPDSIVPVFESRPSSRAVSRAVVAIACFVWWRTELARAFSADAATFLLVVYYALCGVLVLWRGRATGVRALRQTGLALSVFAALAALFSAFEVQNIALRVGSYLAVGAFLLGVAWWYREAVGPGSDRAA